MDSDTTAYLWALLFKWVDVELELRRSGKMREAVVIRHRCRSIGREIRRRYEDEQNQ